MTKAEAFRIVRTQRTYCRLRMDRTDLVCTGGTRDHSPALYDHALLVLWGFEPSIPDAALPDYMRSPASPDWKPYDSRPTPTESPDTPSPSLDAQEAPGSRQALDALSHAGRTKAGLAPRLPALAPKLEGTRRAPGIPYGRSFHPSPGSVKREGRGDWRK